VVPSSRVPAGAPACCSAAVTSTVQAGLAIHRARQQPSPPSGCSRTLTAPVALAVCTAGRRGTPGSLGLAPPGRPPPPPWPVALAHQAEHSSRLQRASPAAPPAVTPHTAYSPTSPVTTRSTGGSAKTWRSFGHRSARSLHGTSSGRAVTANPPAGPASARHRGIHAQLRSPRGVSKASSFQRRAPGITTLQHRLRQGPSESRSPASPSRLGSTHSSPPGQPRGRQQTADAVVVRSHVACSG